MVPSSRWDELELFVAADEEATIRSQLRAYVDPSARHQPPRVPSDAHAFGGERLCQRYCNAMRACGEPGPLCRYCARVDAFMSFVAEWMRR